MKTLGIIGGMGPMASALFVQMIVQMTDAAKDQEHIELFLHNCPEIPDRTDYLMGESGADPCPRIIFAGQKLAEWGAEVIAVPCVTAHCFYKRISSGIPVPVINMLTETTEYLKREGVNKAGLMATDGTIKSGFLCEALKNAGIDVVLPSAEKQRDVMNMVYKEVKANRGISMSLFDEVSAELREKGSEVILLGCTELSVALRDKEIHSGYLDMCRLLAKVCVEQCGNLKKEYERLI